jgi:hypothetical protein
MSISQREGCYAKPPCLAVIPAYGSCLIWCSDTSLLWIEFEKRIADVVTVEDTG